MMNQEPSQPELSSLMLAMRGATNDIHRTLEHNLRIASPTADKTDYVGYVRAMWGWLSPIEQNLWASGWPTSLNPDGRSRKRLWLAEDLRHAGYSESDIAAIPTQSAVPAFASSAERCAWAYVIEGAQLGGQVLKKSLGPSLHPWSPRWLEGYGSETGKNWKTFAAHIDSLDDPQIFEPAMQAACEAFGSLAIWLEKCGVYVETQTQSL